MSAVCLKQYSFTSLLNEKHYPVKKVHLVTICVIRSMTSSSRTIISIIQYYLCSAFSAREKTVMGFVLIQECAFALCRSSTIRHELVSLRFVEYKCFISLLSGY